MREDVSVGHKWLGVVRKRQADTEQETRRDGRAVL